VLHSLFNTAQHHIINERVLNKISPFPASQWNGFSEEEFTIAIAKCNNSSAPRPNKLS